ncbi:MAG: J domain-containing protein [Anaerolineae bacterium]|nr:J domain-containing protein [Anaerolineae bacterium]
MTATIRHWLGDQLAGIDSVRSARAERDGQIVVHTWSGVLIHAYLISEPIKARAVKRILQDNTRVGIGTLFIVDAKIAPEDGAKVEPDEGLLALHALYKDKLYTYRIVDGAPRIGQVHFKAFHRGAEREVWYGPDVSIQHLPCYRVWVHSPTTIKGNWLIAHFGSEAFWKQADYTTGRDAFRREQHRQADRTNFRFWSNPPWSANSGSTGYTTPAPPPQPETELDRSFRQLGLTRHASGDEVKAAFRRLAREVHPDVSALPKAEAEARFKKLHAAYMFIKSSKGW